MLNCRKVSQLISESIDRDLSLITRMRLRMHFLMCGVCHQLRKSMLQIHTATQAHARDIEDGCLASDEKLSEPARRRIQSRLDSIGRS